MSNSRMVAPDVGALVEYGLDSFGREPGKYRVESWLCRADAPHKPAKELLGLLKTGEATSYRAQGWRWCLRKDATHLYLYGVAGTVAPIEKVKVTGHVSESWSTKLVEEHRQTAIRLGQWGDVLF